MTNRSLLTVFLVKFDWLVVAFFSLARDVVFLTRNPYENRCHTIASGLVYVCVFLLLGDFLFGCVLFIYIHNMYNSIKQKKKQMEGSFQHHQIPAGIWGLQAVQYVRMSAPNVFAVIARKFNGNLMVYEAILNANRDIVRIVQYWLDLEPSYRAAKPKERKHDRDSLSTFDTYGYGMTISDKTTAKCWKVQFNQFKKYDLEIKVTMDGVVATVVGESPDEEIFSMFLHDRRIAHLLPTVDKMDVVFIDRKTKRRKIRVVKP